MVFCVLAGDFIRERGCNGLVNYESIEFIFICRRFNRHSKKRHRESGFAQHDIAQSFAEVAEGPLWAERQNFSLCP